MPFSKWFNFSIDNSIPVSLTQQRIWILKRLLYFVGALTVILIIINLAYRLYTIATIQVALIFVLILPVALLVKFNKSKIASYYLLLGLASLTIFSCYVAYNESRYTGTENLFVALALFSIALFEKKEKYFMTFLFILMIIATKVLKYNTSGQLYSDDFFLDTINTMVLASVSIFLMWNFKSSLIRIISHSLLQENLVNSLINNLPLFIGMINKDGNYVIVNEQYEQGFQVPKKEIIGKHYTEVFPHASLKNHEELVKKAMKGNSPKFLEQSTLPDGTQNFVSGQYYPIFGEDFEVKFVTVYVADITELKRTEKKLTEANKTKNQLFSIISHDLRSPLILLHNMLELGEIQELSKEDINLFTSDVRKKLKTVLGTVDNVLHWARSQMEQINSFPTHCSINEIIAENIMLYSAMAEQKGLAIDFQPDQDYMIYADPNHISLIFRNLIHNSLKFTGEGGINFSVTRENQAICVSMKDSGVGMDHETVETLVNHENIISSEGTSGEMGTGLGMSVSLQLLKMNNGSISIESTPGEGSEFIIHLPESQEVPEEEAVPN